MKLSSTQQSKILELRNSLVTQIRKVRTAIAVSRQFEEWKTTRNLTARQSIKILFALAAVESPYWETEHLFLKMAQAAYVHSYEGEWQQVQGLLELEPSFNNYVEYFLEHIGNFNDIQNYLSGKGFLLKPKLYSSVLDRRPVKYPQRKRGYDDKGSRRFPHEYHGEDLRPEKEELRPDRRDQINHPLVQERFKTSQEKLWSETLPTQEERSISSNGRSDQYQFNTGNSESESEGVKNARREEGD